MKIQKLLVVLMALGCPIHAYAQRGGNVDDEILQLFDSNEDQIISFGELDQGTHHDHLVCERCGRIEEFVDAIIEKRQRRIAEKAGFSMTDHSLYIYGVCPKCRRGPSGR